MDVIKININGYEVAIKPPTTSTKCEEIAKVIDNAEDKIRYSELMTILEAFNEVRKHQLNLGNNQYKQFPEVYEKLYKRVNDSYIFLEDYLDTLITKYLGPVGE